MLRCCVFICFLAATAWGQVPIGATKSEVIEKLGWPKSTSTGGDRELLYYPDYSVLLENDHVVKLQFNPKDGKIPNTYTPPSPKPVVAPKKSRPTVTKEKRPATPVERPVPETPREVPAPMVVPKQEQPVPVATMPLAQLSNDSSPTIVERPPPVVLRSSTLQNTIGYAVFRSLAPWALLAGLLWGIKLIFGKKLERKSGEMRDELLRSMNEPQRRALGLPSKLRAQPAPPPIAWSARLLKAIEWHRFEHLVAAYEREMGNDAELTDFGPDGGIDIRVFTKGGRTPKRIIQCKAFNNQVVDVKLVRELMGVMAHEKADQGAFYTTSEFTPPAIELSRGHLDVDLVDGRTFLNRISRLHVDAQARLLAVATEGDYTTPTCASCGVKMILKTASKGRREGSNFWGCRNYPGCQQIINISKTA